MPEIYQIETEHKEHVDRLMEMLSCGEKIRSVVHCVLFENGSVGINGTDIRLNDLIIIKGHLELEIMDRYLDANGIHTSCEERYMCEDCDGYEEEDE